MECKNNLVKGFDKTLKSLEPQTIQHGDYCEVTREQAVELFTIEGDIPFNWIEPRGMDQHALVWYSGFAGLIPALVTHGDMTQLLPFETFKQLLINTVG